MRSRKRTGRVRRPTIGAIDYGSALALLTDVTWYQTNILEEILDMAKNNFDRLAQAVQSVADRVDEVAAAIRNPSVDNNDQAVIDDLAGRLEAASDALDTAVAEENTEDAGTGGAATPAAGDAGAPTDTGTGEAAPGE